MYPHSQELTQSLLSALFLRSWTGQAATWLCVCVGGLRGAVTAKYEEQTAGLRKQQGLARALQLQTPPFASLCPPSCLVLLLK